MSGVDLIRTERQRQVEVEQYTHAHDQAENDLEQLLVAAWCYLGDLTVHGPDFTVAEHMEPPDGWPWEPEFWKPTPEDDVRQLVKAGALIAAEIDRRLTRRAGEADTVTLTRPLCVDGEFSPTETETLTVRRDQVMGL